ncbi:LutC/YkgG family protein [Salimicrobium halophilum]|uniref:L-lactate dehydrogenase complex protein LldG n=1 Tax=Salimicrobium halophilum TaxID=86666 RepID=A0A1G8RKJ2_9BACI|nr:lactate utilization protein C [Salimicrobium halophilum]SDJ17476.1 L-lactate dehydrogenase complex protein LldG [Salimicrobium halophilum]
MTIKNRDSFLNNLAANLGRPRRTESVERPAYSVSPQKEAWKDATSEELLEVFKEQSIKMSAEVEETTEENLPSLIRDLIVREGNSVIAAGGERNDLYGLTEMYEELESRIGEVHIYDSALGKENQVIAERADVGVTFSDVTLAESGTVTLFNDKDNGRSISLLPKTYIAIVPESTIVPRMTQSMQVLREKEKSETEKTPSCVSFITGPSNSADIEMIKIVGVHGPVKAIYVIVRDS